MSRPGKKGSDRLHKHRPIHDATFPACPFLNRIRIPYNRSMSLDPMEVLDPGGPIARRLGERYEHRPEQTQMVKAVGKALATGGKLLVEAGTGVGKSFAYLLPAISHITAHADRPGRRPRVVLATNTIALQEQLIDKDLPLLRAAIPDEFTAVLVKGRGNYVSRRRARRAGERQGELFDESGQLRSMEIVADWIEQTDDGSLATLPQLPAPSVWQDVQSDAEDCLGKRCPTYETCFFQAAQRRMHSADLLVTNHALFFADLSLRREGHGLLPPYDVVILDEAHAAEDVACDHFGAAVSRYQVGYVLSRLHQPTRDRGLIPMLSHKGVESRLVGRCMDLVARAQRAATAFFDAIASWQAREGRSNGRLDRPPPIDNALSPPLQELSVTLRRCRDHLEDEDDRLELDGYARRTQSIADTLTALLDQSLPDSVYWIEVVERRGRQRVKLCASPIEVAPLLRELLFEATTSRNEPLPVILTSATLATKSAPPSEVAQAPQAPSKPSAGGSDPFAHLRQRLGAENALGLQLGSPFDYKRNVALYVTRQLPEPGHAAFLDRMVPVLLEQLKATDGGAFVLGTSYEMLRALSRRLQGPLADWSMPLLVQGGNLSRTELLNRFRHDRRSVLLGADSFWQGVDVPGDALRSVIITKLPFAVPDRPIIEARMQKVQARGGNAFRELSLPDAVLKFKQGFGRLIRSQSDTGRVVVLDPRLVSKPYGKSFIKALPDIPIRDLVVPSFMENLSRPTDSAWTATPPSRSDAAAAPRPGPIKSSP